MIIKRSKIKGKHECSKPKADVKDWNASHDRMSRGITLTEDQAMKMTKALVDRFRARANQEHSTPMRDDYAR